MPLTSSLRPLPLDVLPARRRSPLRSRSWRATRPASFTARCLQSMAAERPHEVDRGVSEAFRLGVHCSIVRIEIRMSNPERKLATMTTLSYADRYENLAFSRDDNGVLTMRFHT